MSLTKAITCDGPVITQADWENIHLKNPALYEVLNSSKAEGKCYTVTLAFSVYVEGLNLVYGAEDIVKGGEYGGKTAHVILRKGDWIYDTNEHNHFRYDEYIKEYGFHVYTEVAGPTFENYKNFFEDILEGGFRKWCLDHEYVILV